MLTKLTARKLLTETGQIDYPIVTIEDGQIISLERARRMDQRKR